jgi:Fic family protein
MKPYIHQKKEWPKFKWDSNSIVTLLAKVRNLQGKIIGKMESMGFDLQSEAVLETITIDVIKSTEIEGEILNPEQVRSSVARRLGFYIDNEIPSERNIDGVVDMLVDATQNFNLKLTEERLFDWHAALFPTGRSGMYKIVVGDWREDTTGPMQVVSGAMGKEKVHFEAPKSDLIVAEMKKFLGWYNNTTQTLDPVLKAAISHLWFITIHPFEDGNGRIARALTDQLLARADGIPQRYYSMSSQIRVERKQYYNTLEKTQQGSLEITNWVVWFLQCLLNSLEASNTILEKVLYKHKFWNTYGVAIQNERQKVMLNKLLDHFDGKLTSSKWAKMTKCSNDTALRDIQDLIKKGILKKELAGGRSTNYEMVLLD